MPHCPIRTLVAAGALALSLLPSVGQAKPVVDCTQSVDTDNKDLNPAYVSCLGSIKGNFGNDPLIFGSDEASYAFVGKSGADNDPFEALGGGLTDGTLHFKAPWVGAFILALKVGNEFSLYKFESAAGVSEIHFDTNGVGGNGNNHPGNLAAAALYGGRALDVPSQPTDPAPAAAVPEPGTSALLLAGLAGIGLLARRRRA